VTKIPNLEAQRKGVDAEVPQTPREVLALIIKTERSRKYVWTAGRVVIEGGFEQFWSNADAKHKKRVLKSITELLEALASEGILEPRAERQSIGYGREKGFDFVPLKRNSN
jgi:hypothetical protein